MAKKSYAQLPSLLQFAPFNSATLTAVRCMFAVGFVTILGCGSNTQRLQQLQNENDRLLSEYRAQRDQVTQLNERLAAAQSRLAESEKLLARQSPLPSSRLSRLNNEPTSLPQFGQSKERLANSGNATRNGTADTSSNTGKRANSGSQANVDTNAGSGTDLYWRPMRRESP